MKIQIRSDGSAVIEGYVNVVERKSRVLRDVAGDFIEIVRAGTFQRALEANPDVGLMFDHVRNLGSQADGVLDLQEDAVGLHARALVSDTEVIDKARSGQLRGWSFGFRVLDDSWTEDDGMRIRTLNGIDLREVSILDVTPAYIATSIEMRDDTQALLEFRMADEPLEVTEEPKPEPEPAPEPEKFINADLYRKKLDILKLK